MQWWLALASVAAVVAIVSALAGNWRGVMWIAAGAAVFVVTAAYDVRGGEHHALVTGFFDGALCLAVYFFGRRRWEMWLWRIFQCSVLISILHAFDAVGGPYWYVVWLELCNYAALIWIGGIGLAGLVGDAGGYGDRAPHRTFRRADHALRAERAQPPFTRQHR